MTSKQANKLYFDWLCSLVCYEALETRLRDFKSLLSKLHTVQFTYSRMIPMDGNREEDGIDLRYRFSYEKKYDYRIVAAYIDNKPCSVLEMMVALALRCEEQIMRDHERGNRTGRWFWEMVDNMGLDKMDEKHFDERLVEETVDTFINREYERNGHGGNIFVVENEHYNLKTMEIWYQMNVYLRKYI